MNYSVIIESDTVEKIRSYSHETGETQGDIITSAIGAYEPMNEFLKRQAEDMEILRKARESK